MSKKPTTTTPRPEVYIAPKRQTGEVKGSVPTMRNPPPPPKTKK